VSRTAISFVAALALLLALIAATAQEKGKAWSDWSKKDAEKMLNNSPWAQTQTDTDTSQMFYSPTSDPRLGARVTSTTGVRVGEGATNQSINIIYRVRFFSARPIRQALIRLMWIQQPPPPEVAQKMTNFAELQATDSIIVSVTYESNDQRYSHAVMQEFNSAITATMKNNSYLDRSDGKRQFLEEYAPPGKDGFGAKFIFLRKQDGQPFISKTAGEIHFHVEYPSGLKIDRRFKVAEMIYRGELEY
jgi:hypothetical protein